MIGGDIMAKKKMTKYQKKVGKVMGEYKSGKLKSSSGKKVKSRKQAIAIALSEARQASPSAIQGALKRKFARGG